MWLTPGGKPLVQDSTGIDPSQHHPGRDLADILAAATAVRAPPNSAGNAKCCSLRSATIVWIAHASVHSRGKYLNIEAYA